MQSSLKKTHPKNQFAINNPVWLASTAGNLSQEMHAALKQDLVFVPGSAVDALRANVAHLNLDQLLTARGLALLSLGWFQPTTRLRINARRCV